MKDNAGLIKFCPITKEALANIEFPKKSGELGTLVCWAIEPFHNKPTVIGTLSKGRESDLMQQHRFELKKDSDMSIVSYTGNAIEGTLNELLVGINDALHSLNVSSISGRGDSTETIQNTKTIEVGEKILLKSFGDFEVFVKNVSSGEVSSLKIDEDGIFLTPANVFKVFGGSEPIPLGDALKTQLNTLQGKVDLIISAIKNGVPIAGDGGVGYQTSMKSILSGAQDADFSGINSEKCFID